MSLPEAEKREILDTVEEILAGCVKKKEGLLSILQQIQIKLGYLPGPAMERVAEALQIPAVDVYGPATFFNQFRLNPPGEYQVKVCMGTACYMVGGKIALDSFERRLEIGEGETTSDRKFSLERVACVGCCSMAPVVMINKKVEGHVTPTRVDGILLEYRDEKGTEEKNNRAESQGLPTEEEGSRKNE